ncbi:MULTISPECIES: YveK family protein [Kocuria]|uniref:YveK family protein n=1 Tax=Kocuria TaxID=57493 RepID=UPI001EE92FDC|nr:MULTISPECIES: Wzz/FepE/Etk N-terminal domain-containing protein [Kocuria]MCT1801700.1 Wzz/FepE/Etk N-terminal domain-containing protein [Kocuria carniphila]
MNLNQYMRCLKQQWWIVVLTAVLGLIAGAGSALIMPKSYESQAQVFVNVANPQSVTDLQMGEQFAMARAGSYAQVATTNSVLQPVVDELGLDATPESLAESAVTVTNQPNTAMITITATGDAPEDTARLAQATAESLVEVGQSLESGPQRGEQAGVNLTVVQRAATPENPAAPSLVLNTALGFFVGLVLGLLIVLVRGDKPSSRLRRLQAGGSHER